MECVGCGFGLSAGFAFCPRCGRRQPAACPACGFTCEPEFAFCPGCGASRTAGGQSGTAPGRSATSGRPAPVPGGLEARATPPPRPVLEGDAAGQAAPRPQADRRQVTVLFADVSGFTSLSERLDPEDVRAFQNALFGMFSEVIARYDGFVEKFVGDAVMAVFGAPVAHEDDPERALAAALDMVGGAERLSETWAGRLGRKVGLHIGIHTGPVVAGSLGEAAGAAYAVTGDTVNTASRILAAAAGSVLVSGATQALTRHRFAFEAPRALELRGKAEPIVVYRLAGALAEPRSARGLAGHGLAAPMVGRADELDQLVAAFERMQRGRAQVVSVVGDAGVGKSRLIAEFLARLEGAGRLAGTVVRRARCASLGEPSYGVFAALCREAYRVEAADSLEVARQKFDAGLRALGAEAEVAAAIAPVLSYLVGLDSKRPLDCEPEQLKRQIALSARLLIERRLDQGPVLIIVEDIHRADAASLELLRDVVNSLAERPLMILLSHRPEAQPLAAGRVGQSVIRLAPLAVDETQALVAGLFGQVEGEAFPQLAQFVAARAGGNPLFIEEIVCTLIDRGVLARRGERWVCEASPDSIEVPATLHGLLLARVDALSADARSLLQEAAVVGRMFAGELLGAVASSPRAVDATLDLLVKSDVIRQVALGHEGARYEFTHALLHEVVYQNVLLSRRAELHERVARALEAAVGAEPEHASDLEALGHHWSLSADKMRGARYLIAAGDRARAVYANEDAVRHYERALRALGEGKRAAGEVGPVRERLADVMALIGRRADALAHYEAVRQDHAATGDRVGEARLIRKIGGLHWEAGERERAKACFMRGLDLLGEEGDGLERAQLLQEVGRLAFRAGDNAGAIAWAERALAAIAGTEQGADVERGREIAATRAHAHNTLGVALARTGRLEEAVKEIERSVALAEAHNMLQAACRGYTNLGVLYSTLDPPRSIETCLRGLEAAKKVGDLGFQSRLYANLAVSYCALTDNCEAEGIEAAHKAIELDRRLGLLDHLAVPLIVLGQIHQCHGEHERARDAYEEALALAEQSGEPQLLFPCYDGLATLALDAGDRQSAEFYLAKSGEVCERAGVEPDALMVLPFLC